MIESKPTCLCIGNRRHRILPVERELYLGCHSYSLRQVLNRKGGLIIGEGDTGKSTYVRMLFEAAERRGVRKPLLVKLRTRPTLTIPDVPDGEVQTIIWDGLDEFPECARDIVDLTADLDPERHHVWVTSRPCNAASVVAASPLLEDVYHLAPFTEDDVLSIADSAKLDGEAFLDAVHGAHLDAFMDKPGGAVILMQLFANGQLDSPSRTELMETIMLDFARETRDGDAECDPKLPFSQRQIVEATSWIAACLVLTGKDAIWTGAKSACPANDLFIEDLPPREYGIALFKAALGLRLFEPLTQERYRLAYSDMPPFLAGRWLAKNFPVERITEIPLDPPHPYDESDEELDEVLDDESYDESMFFEAEPINAIAWASRYDTNFGKPFILNHPESFLGAHQLIKEIGYGKFVTALYRRERYHYANTLHLFGFEDFAKYLETYLHAPKRDKRIVPLVQSLLESCRDGFRASPRRESAAPEKPVEQPPIDIPTERQVAKRLNKPISSKEAMTLIKAERERGFPYLSLRRFFDFIVFRLQEANEPLLRPQMAGCAIVYDMKSYLGHIINRLPPVESLEDHREPSYDQNGDLIDEEEKYEEVDVTAMSVCRAMEVADSARPLFMLHTNFGLDVMKRLLSALRCYGLPGHSNMRGDIVSVIEGKETEPTVIHQTVVDKDEKSLSPADLDDLCRPEPKPVEAVVVEVTPAVREELGAASAAAIKNKGGRPKRSKRDGNYLSQGDMAMMFGPPCNADTVSNWERFVRTNGQAGAQPPSATVDGERVSYTPELRENYTGKNCVILAKIIEAYKSCHAVKTRIGTEKLLHARNDETLYRMQHPDGRIRTENP